MQFKFNIGDKVKFLNDVGGGTISKFGEKNTVHVRTDEGFEIPVLRDELILNEEANEEELQDITTSLDYSKGEGSGISERDVFSEESEIIIPGNNRVNLFFALVPEYEKGAIGSFECFLINDSNYKVLYTISQTSGEEKVSYLAAGLLDANNKIHVGVLEKRDITDTITYNIQCLFYQVEEFMYQQSLEDQVSIHPYEIFNGDEFIITDYFEEKVRLFGLQHRNLKTEIDKLRDTDLHKTVREKETSGAEKQIQPQKRKELEEVDLHIEELTDDYKGLSNAQILEIQLGHFRKKLDEAIRNNVPKIVFIHGIGNGTLRYELRKYLDRHYSQYPYQDASFKEYGFGATMVLIQQKIKHK